MFFIGSSLLPEKCQKIFCSTEFSAEAIQIIEEITNYPIKYLTKSDNSIPASMKQSCIYVANEGTAFPMVRKLCAMFENKGHQVIIFCKVNITDQNLFFV